MATVTTHRGPGGPKRPGGGNGRPFLDGGAQRNGGGPKRRPEPGPESGGNGQAAQGGGQDPEGEKVEVTFMLGAGFNTLTKRPYVEFSVIENGKSSDPVRVPAEAAKALAVNMIVAAEAAIHDAFFTMFLGDHIGADPEMIETLLAVFRDFRTKTMVNQQMRTMTTNDHDPGSNA